MDDLAIYSISAVSLLLGLFRFPFARGSDVHPVVRYRTVFALCLAAAMALLTPASVDSIDRLIPLPNLVVLLGDELRVGAVGALALAAATLQTQRGRRPTPSCQAVLLPAVLCADAVLFALAHTRDDEANIVVTGSMHRFSLAEYNALLTLFTCWCLGLFALTLARRTRDLGTGSLRVGLRVVVCSAVVGMVWSAWGVDDVVTVLVSGTQGGGEDDVSGLLGSVCIVLAAAGGTVSVWRPTWAAARSWSAAYRKYRTLQPLWRAVHEVVPEIVLAPRSRWTAWLPPREAQFALYRRVIEIRDAQFALRPVLDELGGSGGDPGRTWVDEALRCHRAEPHAATREAAGLAAALAAAPLSDGRGGLGIGAAPHDTIADSVSLRPASVEAETDWLVLVAEAFARSSAVADVRIRAQRAAADRS